ncbi:MAG TPA: RES family NAD+ phosphorylase [Kofleriaceae bacterium]|jgi:hypothetical protein
MAKLPEPPQPISIAAETVELPSGSLIWRLYASGGPHPTAWNTLRTYGPTASRFDHHLPPPSVQTRAIFYGAAEPTTCIAEYFQATRIIDRSHGAPWLVAFATGWPLRLLDLTGAWPTRAGASMAINSGPRPRARRWSQAIYDAYPDIHGLLYGSSMHANKPAYALFERCRPCFPAAPAFHRSLADPALAPRVDAAAGVLGYGLV